MDFPHKIVKSVGLGCFSLLSIVAVCQTAQSSTLSGRVEAAGMALPEAIVRVMGTTIYSRTEADGTYTLDNIPSGNHTIQVSLVGYLPQSQTVTITSSSAVKLDFSLKEDVKVLSEVEVAYSISKEKETEGYAVEAISTKEVQIQSLELNHVLNRVSGVNVRQQGGLGSRTNYYINGLGDKAVRFFMDGVPMDYFGSSFSINTIPISLIDRIDIYKGVVPVELGNDALGGAINLVSKPNLDNSAEVSYSYGSFNTHRSSLSGNCRDQSSGATIRLTAFKNHSNNNYKVWGDRITVTDPETFEIKRGERVARFHDAFDSKALKADVGFTQKKWADQFFVGVLLSDMDKEIQHGATMDVPFGEASYHQKVVMPYAVYKKYGLLTDNLDANFFVSHSQMERNRVDTTKNIYNWYGQIEGSRTLGGEQVRTLNTLTQKVFLARTNLVYHFNDQHSLGYNYVFSDLNRSDDDPIINLAQKTEGYYAPQLFNKHSMGWTLQSEWLGERLKTSVFVKWFSFQSDIKTSEYASGELQYSTATSSESNTGYGLAGSFQISPKWTVLASLESAVRLPEANEILGDGLNDSNNPDLKSEKSLNANLGMDFKSSDDSDVRFQIQANAFYRDVKDKIQKNNFQDPGYFRYENFDKVLMKGLDTRLQFFYKKNLTLSQSISYLHPIVKTDKDSFGNDNIAVNSRLPNTPFFQTNTEVRLTMNDLIQKESGVFVYWNVSHVGSFHRRPEIFGRFNLEMIPAQWVHNSGLGYTFPNENLSIGIDIKNMFNRQAFDNYAVQKPGRGAYIKATYRIK